MASAVAQTITTDRAAPRARVVIVQNDQATEAYSPREEIVQTMVNHAITSLTGKSGVSEAWLSLVSTQDVVGIKVFSVPGPHTGTRPAVVEAVARGLIDAGLPPQQIVVWDKSDTDLRLAGYFALARKLGIRCAGSARAGYDESVFYDTPLIGNLIWGDLEFDSKTESTGRKSFVSKLLTRDITKIVNLTPLLNSNDTGVSGNIVSLSLGSVDNTRRFEGDARRLGRAVPEIYALPSLSDRVVLNVVDALVCQYEGGERGMLHYSAVLNELRFSTDPVALDVLSIQELERLRKSAGAMKLKPNMEIYENAALLELGVSDISKIDVERLR
jgi:hypothetical protein